MTTLSRRFVKNSKGAALVEYALIIAGVALIGAAAVSLFGNEVTAMLKTAGAALPGQHAGSAVSGSNEPSETVISVDERPAPAEPSNISDRLGTDGSLSTLVVEPKNK